MSRWRCRCSLVSAWLLWLAAPTLAQLDPATQLQQIGVLSDDAARNVWDAQLVSSQVIAEQMQQALANAPVEGPERALYVRVWACLIDAAVSPVMITFETAYQLCTFWAGSQVAGTARGADKTPYTAGSQSAQSVWSTLQTVEHKIKQRWPHASPAQVLSTAVCAADAANALGTKQGLTAQRVAECAHRAGIAEPAAKPKRAAPAASKKHPKP